MYLKGILAAAAAAACLCGEIWRELHHFRTVTYRLRSKKLEGIGEDVRFVFLSGLQIQAI